jgi:hypothetical protein
VARFRDDAQGPPLRPTSALVGPGRSVAPDIDLLRHRVNGLDQLPDLPLFQPYERWGDT